MENRCRTKRMTVGVETTAPTRIDLAGGTVDIWPLYLFLPDALTLNVAIDLQVRVRVVPANDRKFRLVDQAEKRVYTIDSLAQPPKERGCDLFWEALRHFNPDRGLDIEFDFQAPKGAGLAGSSTLLTAFYGALMKCSGMAIPREGLIRTLRDIETRLIKVPAGMQDYYPAVWGGVQALWWQAGTSARETLPAALPELEKRMILVYTGRSRHSGTNNWEVFKRYLDGDPKVRRFLGRIVSATNRMYEGLSQGDFDLVGRAMAEEAEARSQLFPGIVTPEILELESTLKERGAQAVKVCGAGGGGCVVVYSDTGTRDLLEDQIRESGYELLSFGISPKGLSFKNL